MGHDEIYSFFEAPTKEIVSVKKSMALQSDPMAQIPAPLPMLRVLGTSYLTPLWRSFNLYKIDLILLSTS